MNTAPLKSFAIQSRNILKQGVLNKILELGFDLEGNVRVRIPQEFKVDPYLWIKLRMKGFMRLGWN